VVITGADKTFCSGGNTLDMRKRAGMFAGSSETIARQYREGIQRIPRSLSQLEIPLIAAVNGPAMGAGCGLACLCDIRIASEAAVFAISFIKLGLIPGDGTTWLLPRLVGPALAAEWALTGEAVDAARALAAGLVSRVVPSDQLMPAAMELAERIAANPGQATRWTKRLLRHSGEVSFPVMLDMAATYQAITHHSADHAEALAALTEKRPANFQRD